MKRRTGLGVAIGTVAALALSGATLATTVLTNGSFETGTYVDGGSGFETLAAGDATSIDGWTVDAGSVDWIDTYWTAEEGARSLDLSGTGPGTISQTLATTIGNTYTVSFFLSGNPDGPPTTKTLDVTATGAPTLSYTYDVTGSRANMNWAEESYSFLATSASTKLSFISTTAGAYGPALDDVVITEEVPTLSECKDGGWQTMIDNAGDSFKNQGDCVSYFATGGKNLGAIAPVSAANLGTTTHTDVTVREPKHSTKPKDQSTVRHTDPRSGGTDKPKRHASPTHAPHSHHSK